MLGLIIIIGVIAVLAYLGGMAIAVMVGVFGRKRR
jgi:hypothetical protein